MNIEKYEHEKYLDKLAKLVALHSKVNNIDNSLSNLHPVAIVENNNFLIFDFDEKSKKYFFVKECPTPMPIPEKVKAAFNLQEYDNKMTAVLSHDTFDTLEGYVYTFHEFVHCYQADLEKSLKEDLGIYQDAMKRKDYMWEILYSFPYEDITFVEKTKEIGSYFNESDKNKIIDYYMDMKDHLDVFDFEYMIWQQWKEGYARYIENKIRINLGLGKNAQELIPPFSRVSFYEIGSRYIDLILKTESELKDDLEGLFKRMLKVSHQHNVRA